MPYLTLILLTSFVDVNECRRRNSCSKQAWCINKIGSYQCLCKEGYTGNGKICEGQFTIHNYKTKLSLLNCSPQRPCLTPPVRNSGRKSRGNLCGVRNGSNTNPYSAVVNTEHSLKSDTHILKRE